MLVCPQRVPSFCYVCWQRVYMFKQVKICYVSIIGVVTKDVVKFFLCCFSCNRSSRSQNVSLFSIPKELDTFAMVYTKVNNYHSAHKSYQLQKCNQRLCVTSCAHKTYGNFDTMLRFLAAIAALQVTMSVCLLVCQSVGLSATSFIELLCCCQCMNIVLLLQFMTLEHSNVTFCILSCDSSSKSHNVKS